MDGGGNGMTRGFRRWSVVAFTLLCMVTLASFLAMVFVLGWRISGSMGAAILLIMTLTVAATILWLPPKPGDR